MVAVHAIAHKSRACRRRHARVPGVRARTERDADARADAAAMQRLWQEYMQPPRADTHSSRRRRVGSKTRTRTDGRTAYPHHHTLSANTCTRSRGTSPHAGEPEAARLWLTQCVSASKQRPALGALQMQMGFSNIVPTCHHNAPY